MAVLYICILIFLCTIHIKINSIISNNLDIFAKCRNECTKESRENNLRLHCDSSIFICGLQQPNNGNDPCNINQKSINENFLPQDCVDGTNDNKISILDTKLHVCSLVCYGLGSITDSHIARHQLALLSALKTFFCLPSDSCFIYDPAFTEEDKIIIVNSGLTHIENNEEGKRKVMLPTLFFMPHCPKELYNNLLWANWSPECLSNVILLGNSLSNMALT